MPAAGVAMGSLPSSLLVLVLCLGQAVHMQEGVLPKPSIRAEPGPVIPRGQPVTIVCGGPGWADVFRLEDDNRSLHGDQTVTPPRASNWTEIRFHIEAVSEDTARGYQCRYRQGPTWSERSEILELKVAGTSPEVTPRPIGATPRLALTPGITLWGSVCALAWLVWCC